MWCALLSKGKVLVANPSLNLTTPKCFIMKFKVPFVEELLVVDQCVDLVATDHAISISLYFIIVCNI